SLYTTSNRHKILPQTWTYCVFRRAPRRPRHYDVRHYDVCLYDVCLYDVCLEIGITKNAPSQQLLTETSMMARIFRDMGNDESLKLFRPHYSTSSGGERKVCQWLLKNVWRVLTSRHPRQFNTIFRRIDIWQKR